MKIWKYPIPLDERFALKLPEDTRILCVQVQNNHPCIWALARPDAPKIAYYFHLLATGQEIDDGEGNLIYIGTFQLNNGEYVFHLFQITERRK